MAQVGSASALGAEGRRFKSGYPDGLAMAGRLGRSRAPVKMRGSLVDFDMPECVGRQGSTTEHPLLECLL